MNTPTNVPITDSSRKRRPTRPPPIDINLAEQMRTLQLLPRTSTSRSSSTSHSSSISPLADPKRTPLYVQVYAQMRSPATSPPFPSIMTTPAKVPPNTAVFQSQILYTPSSYSSSSSSDSHSFYSSPLSASRCSPKTAFRSVYNKATPPPFAHSRRLEMLRKILVDPIDTKTRDLPTNPKWFRMTTPIYRRWELFRRPSQLRLARLAEDAWYGVDDSPAMPGGFSERDDDGMEEEDLSSASEDQDNGADGWRGLPTPVSPFEDDLRRVAAGHIW